MTEKILALPSLRPHQRLIRVAAKTNPHYGKSPDDRSVKELLNDGFIVLDKPAGPTSHQVVAWVKDILGVQKAGHGGTLDPAVTGVLPVALGDAATCAAGDSCRREGIRRFDEAASAGG